MRTIRHYQSGAVSLFVVIFAMLLITVVTVSFLRLMVADQQRATNSDLSQSAYDSALAGTEDAKRSLLYFQQICNQQGEAACDAMIADMQSAECNLALQKTGIISATTGEVLVQQSSGDQELQQAYTCVLMALQTPDYIGNLAENKSKLIPLIGVSDTVTSVRVEWYSAEDLSSTGSTANAVDLPALPKASLISKDAWPQNRPPVMRTQLMQTGSSFTLADFDTVSGSESNTNTLFLYPTSGVAAASQSFSTDTRKPDANGNPGTKSAAPVRCQSTVTGGMYACKLDMVLPNVIGGGDRTAFLRLTSFYGSTHFRVSLLDGGGSVVKFDAVQPEIDATGRANDLFRRVVSRVDLIDTSFPYPEAAVDLTGDFCKDFAITNDVANYETSAECEP